MPDPVIQDVREVLYWPIVCRKRIEEKVMPEYLEDEDGAFVERILSNQILVVPDEFSLERGCIDNQTSEDESSQCHKRVTDSVDESHQ